YNMGGRKIGQGLSIFPLPSSDSHRVSSSPTERHSINPSAGLPHHDHPAWRRSKGRDRGSHAPCSGWDMSGKSSHPSSRLRALPQAAPWSLLPRDTHRGHLSVPQDRVLFQRPAGKRIRSGANADEMTWAKLLSTLRGSPPAVPSPDFRALRRRNSTQTILRLSWFLFSSSFFAIIIGLLRTDDYRVSGGPDKRKFDSSVDRLLFAGCWTLRVSFGSGSQDRVHADPQFAATSVLDSSIFNGTLAAPLLAVVFTTTEGYAFENFPTEAAIRREQRLVLDSTTRPTRLAASDGTTLMATRAIKTQAPP
ncbi:hypothetical protein EIP91_006270, partial [Steccherinum ochraceum]